MEHLDVDDKAWLAKDVPVNSHSQDRLRSRISQDAIWDVLPPFREDRGLSSGAHDLIATPYVCLIHAEDGGTLARSSGKA